MGDGLRWHAPAADEPAKMGRKMGLSPIGAGCIIPPVA
ncbi:hypothetical protein AX27061_5359 [Achromobacter xylosoxidans NBRC 15126 = ATCC 27061]|nr:hypothetical protein AX27061_5359 [Achromobacter xylosoxidans NBRC 15126 = ATCC 27061]